MGQFISPDITVGTYTRARLVVDFSANASSNNNSCKAYVQMWRTNTGYTTYGEGTLYIGIDGYGWADSKITADQKISYNSYTQIGSTRSLTINMDATGRWTGRFFVYATTNNDNISFDQQEYTLTLEPCPVYTLSISAGTGSSITANRTSSAGAGSTGNLSAGTKKLYYGDKLKITFTPDTNYSITTNTVNGAAFASGGTHTVSGDVDIKATATPLKSSVAATDARIGRTSSIIITRYNNSYTHTLEYWFGNIKGTIVEKTTDTVVPWTVPTSFFAQIPNTTSGTCTITCTTYNGSTSLGSTTCTLTVSVDEKIAYPLMAIGVVDTNPNTIALTGNSQKIIKYHSDVEVTVGADARRSATLSSAAIKCGSAIEAIELSGTSAEIKKEFTDVESVDISATVVDSRGIPFTTAPDNLTLIEYIKLTVNATATRPGPTSDEVTVSAKGNYYSGSFGAKNNTLGMGVQYKLKSEEAYDETKPWTRMTVNIDGNTYTAEATLTGLDYSQAYDLRVRAVDQIHRINGALADPVYHNISLSKGIPVFDWGEEDFAFNVPISIQSQPVADFIIEQGTSGIWTYEKWASGKMVCWGKEAYTVSFPNTWGGLYETNKIEGETYPIEFAEKPVSIITVQDGCACWLVPDASQGTATKTCDFYLERASATTSSVGVGISFYIIGKWKIDEEEGNAN